jgi:hypothetical protein
MPQKHEVVAQLLKCLVILMVKFWLSCFLRKKTGSSGSEGQNHYLKNLLFVCLHRVSYPTGWHQNMSTAVVHSHFFTFSHVGEWACLPSELFIIDAILLIMQDQLCYLHILTFMWHTIQMLKTRDLKANCKIIWL